MFAEYMMVGAAWGFINMYRAYKMNKNDPHYEDVEKAVKEIEELGVDGKKMFIFAAILQFGISLFTWPLGVAVYIYKSIFK